MLRGSEQYVTGLSNLSLMAANFARTGTFNKNPPNSKMSLEVGCASLNNGMYLAALCTQHWAAVYCGALSNHSSPA